MSDIIIEDNRYGEGAKTVLVIGNGFDLNLGLKTSYKDFANSPYWPFGSKKFCSFGGLGRYINRKSKNNWFDLEQALKDYSQKDRVKCRYFQENSLKEYDILVGALQDYLKNAEKEDIDSRTESALILTACRKSYVPIEIVSFNYTNVELSATKLNTSLCRTPSYLHGNLYSNDIIIGTDESVKVPSRMTRLLKSSHGSYKASMLSNSLSHNDNIIFFGVSFNDIDYPHIKPLFDGTIKTKKRIWIIDLNQTSIDRIQSNISRLTGRTIHDIKKSFNIEFVQTTTCKGREEIEKLCEMIGS